MESVATGVIGMVLAMWPIVARQAVCRTHELLLRRPTFREVRSLEASQWESPAALCELQQTKLRALLRHAHERIPFYRDRLNSAGVDVNTDASTDVLAKIPPLDKDQIRESLGDMVWHRAPGGLFPYNTGGSGGEPLSFFFDRRRQACDQAARVRTHRWFGVKLGQREVFLWGSPVELSHTDRLRSVRDALFNHRLLSAFDMSPQRMDEYLDIWDRKPPACLFGYPSSIALLVEHARARDRYLNTKSLQAVFVTGEVCYPHHHDTIEGYFQVPVADGYGSREAGFIAHQCPQGQMHVTAEHVIVEILRGNEVLPPGEPGEIVITHLDAYAMPFIRYRTGDVGRLKPGRCACGRGLPLMDVVHGRATDFLHLPCGTTKHALAIVYPLRALPGIRQFRVTQHEDYSVTIDVVHDKKTANITIESVHSGVRPVLGHDLPLKVNFVDRIGAARSGKFRYVVSHAQPHGVKDERGVIVDD